MSYTPSHQNSTNERNERRQNHKDEISRLANAKKPLLAPAAAHAKFDKLAAAFLAAGKVARVDNTIRVSVGAGKSFFPVYRIGGRFVCECGDRQNYGFCAHEKAAAAFADREELEAAARRLEDEKPFLATLRWGNRKGLDFDDSARFETKRAACEWLATESFNKFQPEGEVTDIFGDVVFEIADEFFDLWAEV